MASSLLFIISFDEPKLNLVKQYVESFFEEVLEEESNNYPIDYGKPKRVLLDNVALLNTYELEVKILFTGEYTDGLVRKIVQDWCNPKKNPLSHLWLNLKNVSVLENSGKLCHYDVHVKEIAFGTLADSHHFMEHYGYKSSSDEKEISATFVHSQRKCMVYTCLTHKKSCKYSAVHNKFQLFYNSISRVIVNYLPNSDVVEIFFHLLHVPFLFIGKSKNEENESSSNAVILACDQEYQEKNWDRALYFGCDCNQSYFYLKTIGQCLVFKITVPKKHKTHEIVERLIQRCPSSTVFYFASMETVVPSLSWENFKNFPFSENLLKHYQKPIRDKLMFTLHYAWETVMSQSHEVKDQLRFKCQQNSMNVWTDFCRLFESYFRKNDHALVCSLHEISDLLSKRQLFDFQKTLENYFSFFCKQLPTDELLPDGMCLVRRIILTPSRIIYIPPSEHFDNRVIREFGSEFFLRVFVQDDDFSKLTFAIKRTFRKRELMDLVFKKILIKGFLIYPRKYELLASSNSQLREHGLYMYAKDFKGNTAASIRMWMGDFSKILNVAKYMARMGQCFSTSEEGIQIKLDDVDVLKIKDVKTTDEKYTFSDGVGMISTQLAKEIRKKYAERNELINLNERYLYDPSAFQIRFKGCKGMVAESPTLSGSKIAIRPSMNKFECSSSSDLEIVKISAPRAVFLNRSLISILENLGIPESVFLDLQKKMVFDLTDSLIYEKKAYKMLENSTSLDFPFKRLHKSGISMAQEPFFRSLLLCVYRSLIEKLKSKARIAIPHKYGRNMLGIMDETNTLEYGQIFAQYSVQVGNIKSEVRPLLGTVVVTKHPCMHPGDVRKFKAVWVEGLKHIKDCIVFPAKGPRPHPDEMAGSDLDGDEYAVFWEPHLIFKRDNAEAMNYPPNEEEKLEKKIEVSDMVEFFCRYVKDDQIGVMANAHLAFADHEPEGVFSKVCMQIAAKYPKALDFAKSGTTCTLDASERPRCYPDFMEKGSRNNSYKSRKALGLLYRIIRNLEASLSNISSDLQVECDPKLEYPGWREFEELAQARQSEYSYRVKSIFKKYGLENEAEVLSGYIGPLNNFYNNKYDSENIVLLSKKYFIGVIKNFKMKFELDCHNHADASGNREEVVLKMASAWYMVTYRNPQEKILSFPWIASEYLQKIHSLHNQDGDDSKYSASKFIEKSDQKLKNLFPSMKFRHTNACYCVSVLYQAMSQWMRQSSFILTTSSDNTFCSHCLGRIVEKFRGASSKCCSFSESLCDCNQLCSPMQLIMECLKYYASEVVTDLGFCGRPLGNKVSCEGFQDTNLHSLALKTYAALAMTKSLYYLGLEDQESSPRPDCDMANDEGDPIRVPVTKEFEDILTGNVDKVCKILEKMSGVKKIHIDGSSEKNGYYILVHSIGRAFQRWNLEELIMDSKCPERIRGRLS